MVLGQHVTRDIHLAAADMGVQIYRARHHDPAGNIVLAVHPLAGSGRGDNTAVANEYVAHFAVNLIDRVVDFAAFELSEHQRNYNAFSISATTWATEGSALTRSFLSGSATTLSVR